jgi:serine O-acetyltransferase
MRATGAGSERARGALIGLLVCLMSPMLVLFELAPDKQTIIRDVARWAELLELRWCSERQIKWQLLQLLAILPEFRNVYYYRVSQSSVWLKVLAALFKLVYQESCTLSISARDSIGPGLIIRHGFSTVVAADRIGANCLIHQQVTIGYTTSLDCPTLGNYVVVGAGAKVLGSVRVGDHVVVGANSVVVKDVPDNCVVVGVPARIVRRNGIRVDEALV